MWILMYVFSYSVSPAATNDRAEWRLLPTVVFQEFSNEERCKAAKSSLEGSLKEAGAKLKSGLEDLKSIGKADPCRSSLPLMWNAFRNKVGDHDRRHHHLDGTTLWKRFIRLIFPSSRLPQLAASLISKQACNAAYWHETDTPTYLGDVRCWLNSGKQLLALRFRRCIRRPV